MLGGSAFKSTCVSSGPAPTGPLPIICNCRRYHPFSNFCRLYAYIHALLQIYTCRQNTHAQKIRINKCFLKRRVKFSLPSTNEKAMLRQMSIKGCINYQ